MEHIRSSPMLMLICWTKNTNIVKKKTGALLEAGREDGEDVNTEKTKCMFLLAIKIQDEITTY
jgi:hypothetical protein